MPFGLKHWHLPTKGDLEEDFTADRLGEDLLVPQRSQEALQLNETLEQKSEGPAVESWTPEVSRPYWVVPID